MKVKPETQIILLKRGWYDYAKIILLILSFFVALGFLGSLLSGPVDGYAVRRYYYDHNLRDIDSSDVPEKAPLLALIDLTGVMVSDSMSSVSLLDQNLITPNELWWQIGYIEENIDVEGIILRISSPGGTLIAADELAAIVKELRTRYPVFVYSNDILASGGYYVAAQADGIFAHRNAEIGSIGVIYEIPNIQNLAEDKLGITLETYKAGEFKDLTNPFRSRTDEEKQIIQKFIDSGYNQFIDEVSEGRSMERPAVETLATGLVWEAQEAKELGLIDQTMYQKDLIPYVQDLLEIKNDVYLVQYGKPATFFESLELLSVKTRQSTPFINYAEWLLRKPAGAYYLYYR